MPWSLSAFTIAQANTTPMTRPSSVPSRAMMTDSHRTLDRSWRRVMPTARSRPSSWRAFDDREPERVGDAEERDHDGEEEQHIDQVQELVDLRGLRRLVLVAGLAASGPGNWFITFLIAAVFAGVTPPFVFT